MKDIIRHREKLSFCEVTIFADYIYVIMNSGIHVKPEYNDILIDLTRKFFCDTKFVYITHRINSYSVDPTIYLDTSKISNLIGFIIIEPRTDLHANSEIENLFFEKPFVICSKLESALRYKDSLIESALDSN